MPRHTEKSDNPVLIHSLVRVYFGVQFSSYFLKKNRRNEKHISRANVGCIRIFPSARGNINNTSLNYQGLLLAVRMAVWSWVNFWALFQ